MFEEEVQKSPETAKASKSQIEEQFGLLEKSRARLASTIKTLEEKLSPVLSNISEDKATSDTPRQELAPLADAIRNQEENFNYLNRRVREIIERLQL